jgi:hypothetical protein
MKRKLAATVLAAALGASAAPGVTAQPPREAQMSRELERSWNAGQLSTRAVSARCRLSTNGRFYCHLELRPSKELSLTRHERCLYVEIAPPLEWLRVAGTVCDDGGGLAAVGPLPRGG